MASNKGHGGAGKAPIPDVEGLPLESAPFSSSSTLIPKGVKVAAAAKPGAAAAAGAAGAAANSFIRNDPNVSYSDIINTYKCKAEETHESCMQNKLMVVGLTHVPIVGDGNCLFYSFERFFNIYNLPEQTKTHLQIRHDATEYLETYSRAFLSTFEVPEEEQPMMDAILNSVITPANRAAKNFRAALENPDYLEAKNALFLEAIEANKEEGTFASGIGDIMPECLARRYGIQISIYDYSPIGDQGFRVVKIDPSEVSGRPNRGHIRLERINANHFNLLIPTMTLDRYPRVRVLVEFYTALYHLEVAKEELVAARGMVQYTAKGEQRDAANAIVAAQRAKLGGLQDLLKGQIVVANAYLPKRGKKVSVRAPAASVASVAASVAPKKASVASAASSVAASVAAPKKAADAAVAAGYKPIKSAVSKKSAVAVAAPPPIKKMNMKKGLQLFENLRLNSSSNSNSSGTRKKKASASKASAAKPAAKPAAATKKSSSRLAPAKNND